MLAGVEEQEGLTISEVVGQRVGGGIEDLQAEGAGHRLSDQAWIGDHGQVDEEQAVGEGSVEVPGHLYGQPGLPAAGDAGKGDQGLGFNHLVQLSSLGQATDEG